MSENSNDSDSEKSKYERTRRARIIKKLQETAPFWMVGGLAYIVLALAGFLPAPDVRTELKAFVLVGGFVGILLLPISAKLVRWLQQLHSVVVYETSFQDDSVIKRFKGGKKLEMELNQMEDSSKRAFSWRDNGTSYYLVNDFEPSTSEYSVNWLGADKDVAMMEEASLIRGIKEVLTPLAKYSFNSYAQREIEGLEYEAKAQVASANDQFEDSLLHPEVARDEELMETLGMEFDDEDSDAEQAMDVLDSVFGGGAGGSKGGDTSNE